MMLEEGKTQLDVGTGAQSSRETETGSVKNVS